ncbi:FtsX-like permease family protein [Sporosarcina aquimarina]|uniref:FtsX-like permease family protein n=1 Tax=Sporosarcina aquimarina TaxID=114975 RepID=A0ABU4G1N3_9BACL|nr:FtsX-like permease family protein [Sporosarcina aquimarina]MDW0110885.1 FtsX-like permease family protein [Sporosarcina aquimarina]
MTALTLFDLVVRSMRKNLKHYYLYFFALILSVVLYFVFASLQHDASVLEQTDTSFKMASGFKAAGILLLFISGVFLLYANSIFLKRRGREVGLYQLIGLSKFTVTRMLVTENLLLGTGALAIGIGIGLLVSRVFLLLLMKLIGIDGVLTLSFSGAAILQTIFVFVALLVLTSLQMAVAVKRSTLLELFKVDQSGERVKKPKTAVSAIFGTLGVLLIGFGYWLSGHMLNSLLFFYMIVVLVSVILGTYLLFRVTIGWAIFQIRTSKNGHLGLSNSLSLAPLIHRLKANANSLTIITVLSAMTLTMIAAAYSTYYSSGKESRLMEPFDYMIVGDPSASDQFLKLLDKADISYHASDIEGFELKGDYEKELNPMLYYQDVQIRVVSESQLSKAGLTIEVNDPQSGVLMAGYTHWMLKSVETPVNLILEPGGLNKNVAIERFAEGNAFNDYDFASIIVVKDELFQTIRSGYKESGEIAQINTVAINLQNKDQLKEATELYNGIESSGKRFDYYTQYQNTLQSSGMLIFIAGFLGLVFLISTGSILYFKQMTEAEQEKASYTTLRQLGFSVQEIMRGVIKKQVFVFGLPLLIGLLHSIFALKSASFIFMSDVTVPTVIAMSVYIAIYLVFAFLTVGYYRKTIKAAL